jgi:hypothetical protein
MRPERAPLLSSYLSSPAVGRWLYLWPIFSYVTPCFGFWLPSSVYVSFQSTSVFSPRGFCFTSLWGFAPFFMPERIGLRQAVC